MPACRYCEKIQPSAEVRRTPLGHVCKDKIACKRRAAERKEKDGRSA